MEGESDDCDSKADEGKVGHHILQNGNEEKNDSEEDGDRGRSALSKELADELFEKMFSEKEKEDMALMANWKPPRDFRENVKADFMAFMDRDKVRGRSPGFA